ncbi:von Willebrand factor type A domain protein [Anatilimnocola aggregata]|uniref:von Willebrand factor type A domain protein n=1 Tax=Anatilimnocola aggregata TaxID=2528021 RepID=A0A517YCN0_9BACT|nr:VWA domain-containing protein [Anatilimnocola aggregata]QDU27996.1 von Willebrand factor type A domain protein [Anatilimnocola aggregata]
MKPLASILRIVAVGIALHPTHFSAICFADNIDSAFRAAKSKLVLDLRSSKAEVRSAAITRFKEFPTPDAANTLLLQGSLSKFPDVRRGCFAALRSYANSEVVGKELLTDVLRDLKVEKIEAATAMRMIVLLSSDDPKVKEFAQQAFDQTEKSPAGVQLLVTIVDQLAEMGDSASARSLYHLSDLPLTTSHAGLKRALVQALCKIDEPEAVAKLVQAVTTAEGETRADIERRLIQLSGLKAEDRPDWPGWWQEKQTTFVFPHGAKPEVGLFAKAVANIPSYYGLPLYGSKIVFVIDYSGSMRGAKLDAAKWELQNAIAKLPDGVRFNVLAFNSVVIPWKRELVQSSPESKQEAVRFIIGGDAGAQTASYNALEAALSQDCDAIYFLTDGAPRGSKIDDPQQIVTMIGRRNRVRRATINVIGIGVGNEGNAFDVFLRELAAQNFGAYRRLD